MTTDRKPTCIACAGAGGSNLVAGAGVKIEDDVISLAGYTEYTFTHTGSLDRFRELLALNADNDIVISKSNERFYIPKGTLMEGQTSQIFEVCTFSRPSQSTWNIQKEATIDSSSIRVTTLKYEWKDARYRALVGLDGTPVTTDNISDYIDSNDHVIKYMILSTSLGCAIIPPYSMSSAIPTDIGGYHVTLYVSNLVAFVNGTSTQISISFTVDGTLGTLALTGTTYAYYKPSQLP